MPKKTKTSFTIVNTYGITGPAWRSTYTSLDAARGALRDAMGWKRVWLYGPYSDTDKQSWSAYDSKVSLARDPDGSRAPRINAE